MSLAHFAPSLLLLQRTGKMLASPVHNSNSKLIQLTSSLRLNSIQGIPGVKRRRANVRIPVVDCSVVVRLLVYCRQRGRQLL